MAGMTFEEAASILKEDDTIAWDMGCGNERTRLRGWLPSKDSSKGNFCFCPVTAIVYLKTGQVFRTKFAGACSVRAGMQTWLTKVLVELADDQPSCRYEKPEEWSLLKRSCLEKL